MDQEKPMGGICLVYSTELHQEVGGLFLHFCQVSVAFVPVVYGSGIFAGHDRLLHIPFSVSSHQKHIQQCGAAVEMELSGRYFVQSRIG